MEAIVPTLQDVPTLDLADERAAASDLAARVGAKPLEMNRITQGAAGKPIAGDSEPSDGREIFRSIRLRLRQNHAICTILHYLRVAMRFLLRIK